MADPLRLPAELAAPSPDFLTFRAAFFDDPWLAARLDYDRGALRRLRGAEREAAARAVEANLDRGPQFAHAAADLQLDALVPALLDLLDTVADPFEYSVALVRMGAVSPHHAAALWRRFADADEDVLERILPVVCEQLSRADAAGFVCRGLASADGALRGLAHDVLLELEHVVRAGAYTPAVAEAAKARWVAALENPDARFGAVRGELSDPEALARLRARANAAGGA